MLDWLVWPWAEQRKAERQLAALLEWHGWKGLQPASETLHHLHTAAKGYAKAHDWVGVEACYMKARAYLEEG